MRGWLILFFVFGLFTMGIVSASFECTNSNTPSSDIGDIGLGKVKTVNGLPIGVIKSDETPAINRIEVSLLIDAKSGELTDAINYSGGELVNGDTYNITLINSTENTATLKNDGDTKIMEEGDLTIIGGLEVYLKSTQGSYPGTATIDIAVGDSVVDLSSDVTPYKIVTVENKDYGLEIYSASDDNALIKVSKCENASTELKWAESEKQELNESTNETNSTDINNAANETNNTEQNDTIFNETSNTTDTGSDGNSDVVSGNQQSKGIPSFIYYVIIGIIAAIVLLLILRYARNKTLPKDVKEGIPDVQRESSADSIDASTNEEPDEED